MTLTLETLNPADNQQVFDFVVAKLREQGCQSMDTGDNTCMYRGRNDTKCAAGHLIPDCDYEKSWECSGVHYQGTGNAVSSYFDLKGYDCKLINELQKVHDSYCVNDWEHKWKLLAETFGLTYTPIAE